MKLLQDPPAEFDGIQNAFAMARLLPSSHRLGLKIGLESRGVLVAAGELDGLRQVRFFTEHLRRLGCEEHLLGSGDEMHGCDMLFSVPASLRVEDDDPSFIRRPAPQLWPARS